MDCFTAVIARSAATWQSRAHELLHFVRNDGESGHCEERSDVAIWGAMDCFTSFAMTGDVSLRGAE